MTTSERFYEFKDTISGSDEAKPESIVLMLKFDLDHVAEVIKTEQGSCHIRRMLGISERFNTTILKHVMANFTEVMTHKHSYKVALRVLEVCNPMQKSDFCNLTLRHALLLARDEYGCTALKQVITLAEDRFKDEFIDLIAQNSILLSPNALGYSVIQYALSNYTRKETTRLHELVAEFNETLTRSDITKLHKLVLMLTSDSDEFLNFIKTREGSLIIHIILGKSEEIDTIFLVAVKRRVPDVVSQNFGYNILLRIIHLFIERGDFKVYLDIRKLMAMVGFNRHNKKIGGARIESTVLDMNCTKYRLHRPYMELSFEKYGSNFVEQLLVDDDESWMMASDFVVEEIAEYSDEDMLVRLANDEYGNKVLKKTLEAANVLNVDLFVDLVKRSKPLLDLLRGSHGGNIAAIIDSPSRLHALMMEFDEISSRSEIKEFHRFASKITSDSYLFADFIMTRRGLFMLEIILGKSEEIDIMLFEAIQPRFTDILTIKFMKIFEKRELSYVHKRILRLFGVHALYLAKDPLGSYELKRVIDLHNLECTAFIVYQLYPHYIELSFEKFGSNVVEKLIGDSTTDLALALMVKEKIMKCDEDTLVRWANNEYGNKVLKKTLEAAKERRVDLFGDLVEKLKPFLGRLRGARGENIAAIIHSETITVRNLVKSIFTLSCPNH